MTATFAFDPGRSILDATELVPDATVIPWASDKASGFRRSATASRRDGSEIANAVCWRGVDEVVTVRPKALPEIVAQPLPGRWLFGGLFYAHFGHFLCESTARLWALDHVGPVDGVLFFPKKRMTWPDRIFRPYRTFFAALGLQDLALNAPNDPVEVEELVVPEQGFGVGEMAAGRPEFRDFMTARLGRDIAPEGPENLYISRSRLMSKRGTILAEERLEALLEASGYHVFHPQEHPLETQIARYKAARRIISMDASPLHLAGFVVAPGTAIAILNRAPSRNIDDYVRQFEWFKGITPATIDTIDRYWFPADQRLVKRETIGLMDFGKVGAFLEESGYIADARHWRPLDETAVSAAVAEREARLGVALAEYRRDEASTSAATA